MQWWCPSACLGVPAASSTFAYSEAWLVAQYDGELWNHIEETMQAPSDSSTIRWCFASWADFGGGGDNKDDNNRLIVADEMCQLFGSMCTSMAMRRASRVLWVFGWPIRMAGINGPEQVRQKTIRTFKSDVAAWQGLVGLEHPPAGVVALLRSIFRGRAVLQYIEARADSAGAPDCLACSSSCVPAARV